MAQDHYRVLGIEPNASEADIKRAFRSLAHAYHPDKEGGDEILFKKLTLAYSVLGNEKSRKEYDSGRTGGTHKTTETPPPPVRPQTPKAAAPAANNQMRNGMLIAAVIFIVCLVSLFSQESTPASESMPAASSPSGLPKTGPPTLAERLEAQQPDPEVIVLGSQGMSSRSRPVTFSELSMTNLGKTLPAGTGNNFGYFAKRTVKGTYWKLSFTIVNDSTKTIFAKYSLPVLKDQMEREFRPEQVYTCAHPYENYGRVQTSLQVWNTLSEQIPLKPGIPCEIIFLFEVSDESTEFLLHGEFI